MQEFKESDLRIDPDMEIDCDIGRIVTAYVETWFDVDEKFGTDTKDDENAWVNFYAKYDTRDGSLMTEYCVSRPDSSEEHDYVPIKDEALLITKMMEDCCQQHHGCSLKEYCEQTNDFDMTL